VPITEKSASDENSVHWHICLFKQNLTIKKSWGHSENAVRIQLWVAIIAYLLVAYVKHAIKSDLSIYEIIQILGVSVFDKKSKEDLSEEGKILDSKSEALYRKELEWELEQLSNKVSLVNYAFIAQNLLSYRILHNPLGPEPYIELYNTIYKDQYTASLFHTIYTHT